jgi:GAF domain-containing protein
MPFATALSDALRVRLNEAPSELSRGDSLEHVLNRHLLAIEGMAEGELLTSILLLDRDSKRLFHGAAPNLPHAYCDAIDGVEIGPCAGSCGTAAYHNRAVYVTDIASDPLWAEYRHLALPHGLRACWSTPIRDTDLAVIGTFAVYHRTTVRPTAAELAAIRMITDHVARAIQLARSAQDLAPLSSRPGRKLGALRIVPDVRPVEGEERWFDSLRASAARLRSLAEKLSARAETCEAPVLRDSLRSIVTDCRSFAADIQEQLEGLSS